ncbi:NADH-quinone oxidoreductase subunit NuoN [Bacillaceae bacterium]
MKMTEWPWGVMAPEFTILAFATLLSLLDLVLPKRYDRRILAWLGLAGVVLAAVFVLQNVDREVTQILNGMFRLDAFGNAFKLLLLSAVGIVFLLSLDREENGIPYRGEYCYLLLTALLGTMIMASSADMLTLFIGLEVLTVSSYILVGLRKKHLQTNEAAFKYVVAGGISTALTLYGMSFIYGLTGSTNLFVIAERLGAAFQGGYDFLVYLAFFLVFVGLSFKLVTVPYHMWAPDVYQGAPTPVTAFLSVVSKTAGFAIVLRFFLTSFREVIDFSAGGHSVLVGRLALFIGILAALSMIVGNTLALRQTNVKRMMAYSSIAQAGYLLVPFATITQLLFEQTLFYLVAYLLMNLGAFAVIMIVNRDRGTEDIKSFAGLYHRAPWTAVAMTVFLLSLAGIPVTAGFFGKFYIFLSSVALGNYWLPAIMLVTSLVSYYYYFGIIRQMYMRPGNTEAPLKVPGPVAVVILIALVGTVGAGIAPEIVIGYLHHHFDIFGEMFVEAAP